MQPRKLFGATIALCLGLNVVACDDKKAEKPAASIEKKDEAKPAEAAKAEAPKPAEAAPAAADPAAADPHAAGDKPGEGEVKADAEMEAKPGE